MLPGAAAETLEATGGDIWPATMAGGNGASTEDLRAVSRLLRVTGGDICTATATGPGGACSEICNRALSRLLRVTGGDICAATAAGPGGNCNDMIGVVFPSKLLLSAGGDITGAVTPGLADTDRCEAPNSLCATGGET